MRDVLSAPHLQHKERYLGCCTLIAHAACPIRFRKVHLGASLAATDDPNAVAVAQQIIGQRHWPKHRRDRYENNPAALLQLASKSATGGDQARLNRLWKKFVN